MAGGLEDLQNHLPVQILVLCSLGVQLVLFLCAGVRRRETSSGWSAVLLFFLWLSYNLGDTFATFTIGRLSFVSTTGNHPLVVLWAPFLLLHLAGPDNISAYALQDNQLSLRSLQTFFTQVIAGGYFLIKYRKSSGHFIRLASRLMFVVGVVKYGEWWLAMRRGNLGSIRDSVKKQAGPAFNCMHAHRHDVKLKKLHGLETLDEESSLRLAHSLFHICKCGMVDSGKVDFSEDEPAGGQNLMEKIKGVEWTVVEIELSLMYDILYTKAAVIHTRHGYAIRLILPLAILASLLLFHFSEEEEEHRDSGDADAAITYILFCSALFMEWTSLLNALGSSWMFATLNTTRSSWLRYTFLCSGRWDRLRRFVVSLSSLVTCGRARRWSGHMGQYNMLHFCTRPNSFLTRSLLGRLASLVLLGELWNRKYFSGAIKFSDHDLINKYITKHAMRLYLDGELNTLGMITPKWGMKTLKHHVVVDKFEQTLGYEFQEGIIIWHIGTDFFLCMCNTACSADRRLVKAIKALSNYMMFLLVDRPYMLPGIAHNKLYERTCQLLQGERHHPTRILPMLKCLLRWHDDPVAGCTSRATDCKIHAENLYDEYVRHPKFTYKTARLTYSAAVAQQLRKYQKEHDTTKSLELLLEVWVDMLVYAGNKCSRESHAKKLSSGGELTTVVWLLMEHYNQALLEYRASSEASCRQEYHGNSGL